MDRRTPIRVTALLTGLALVAAACANPSGGDASRAADDITTTLPPSSTSATTTPPSSTSSGADTSTTAATTTTSSAVNASGLPVGPSALSYMFEPGFPPSLVDPDEIISGGPPPDGIPPIDNPVFTSITDADTYLSDAEPVVVLDIEGDARAYPAQILIWHEIVNDVVGGVPVSVTYCPLCNSAVTYERMVRGVETTFGTSGRLFASALVMYDRATETLWTHFDGRAVVGVLAGDQLEPISSPLMAWSDFKETYPDGLVLDRAETGFTRSYGTNPYLGYDDPEGFPFLFRGDADPRATELQRVVGIDHNSEAVAYLLSALAADTATSVNIAVVGGDELVLFWKAGQSSALEATTTADGRSVGTVGVYLPIVDGSVLTFDAAGESFLDRETGSLWSVAGVATEGPLAGSKLTRVPHLDTFWFAWSTYQPGTVLIDS